MKLRLKLLFVSVMAVCAGLCSCADEPDEKVVYSIQFTENPVIVGYNAADCSTVVISQHEWTAASTCDWISDVRNNAGELQFKVSENTDVNLRDGVIRLTVKGADYSKDLTVRQSGNSGGLNVGSNPVALDTEGNEVEIKVSSSENWSVTSVSGNWIRAVKKSSTALSVSADVNFTGEPLTGEIVIETVSKDEKVIVSVTQEYDAALFCGAATLMGKQFVFNGGNLVTRIVDEESYSIGENVNVLEMQYLGSAEGSLLATSVFVFDINLGKDVSLAVSCTDDDDSSIKPDDSEVTLTSILRDQLSAMQTKRSDIEVLGGVNGDFFYGGVGASGTEAKNNLLHGVVHRGSICVKGSFDGGSACTVFSILKDGKAKIMSQSLYGSMKGEIAEALGGRQQLLSGGSAVSFTDKRREPRTAVGVSMDGNRVTIIVVDGRRNTYSNGASYAVLAKMMLAFGAFDAINLDGGGSSTFAIREGTGASADDFTTRNRPTDNTGERKVVNGLAIVRMK